MGKRETGYKEAIEEIERIVAELEAENIDVDVIAEKVKRATHLITVCKNKLKGAEEQVQKALEELNQQDRGDDEPF
jgi:exodeoxyribonuclease VII small subunit